VDTSGTDISGQPASPPRAADAVTILYAQHAVGLIKLAYITLGDRPGAEDVVQEAFLGLYRHWDRLTDQANALTYVRSAVLNNCRAVLRYQVRRERRDRATAIDESLSAGSPEAAVLLTEEHEEVLAAVRRLPARQREALILRVYLGLSPDEAAQVMGISPGTVKSATSRAIATLGATLKEES